MTPAATPDAYVEALDGWRREIVETLRTKGSCPPGQAAARTTSLTRLEKTMRRKHASALVVFAVIAASFGCAQTPAPAPDTAADQARLQADALSWFEHYANADADGMANLYAEDAILMPPGAPAVTGRSGIRTFLGADAANSKAAGISLKNASVTGTGVQGDIGWISGTYVVVDSSGATIDGGSYLSVHRRTDGAWPYIRDIWNSDRPPAPPAAAAKPPAMK